MNPWNRIGSRESAGRIHHRYGGVVRDGKSGGNCSRHFPSRFPFPGKIEGGRREGREGGLRPFPFPVPAMPKDRVFLIQYDGEGCGACHVYRADTVRRPRGNLMGPSRPNRPRGHGAAIGRSFGIILNWKMERQSWQTFPTL